MQKTNNERLQEVADAMQAFNERIVYVGGAMAGSYATDAAAAEPRATLDVDCVVNSGSYAEHAAFEDLLRAQHFQNDRTSDAPLCRWWYKDEIVDVMSIDESSLSFGNKWYRPGFEKRERYTLPSGMQIYRLPVTYYIATKIDALNSRGGEDWRGAKDFEDIIYVLNYCPEFTKVFLAADVTVKTFIAEQFAIMIERPNITEEIECALSHDEIERTDILLETIRTVAAYSITHSPLRIQFVSDLHLEFHDNSLYLKQHPLQAKGDILLIGGDSAYLDSIEYVRHPFWQWASEHYKEVIVALGNHEFYNHYDVATLPDGFVGEILPNVHYYYNAVVHIQDVDIIVSTLWGHIEPQNIYATEHGVSDFYHILYNGHRLTAEEFSREHERCLKFIKEAVVHSQAQTKIVLTHHVPTMLATAPEFAGSPINGAFSVELSDYIAQSGIDYWIYGHSHRNINCQIGSTQIISNQLGYVFQGEHLRNGFDNGKIIEL
mgnify:CR=1 FL=1